MPLALDETGLPTSGSNAVIEAWSGGYLDFVWDAHKRVLTAWLSPDGRTWTPGGVLKASPWAANFKAYDADETGERDSCSFLATQFQEGPATLLLSGHLVCIVGCASGTITEITTWTSRDGSAWAYLDTPKVFGSAGVGRISGGSSGFAALGFGKSTSLWLSADGRSWRHGSLPADVLAPGSSPRDPAAFGGGFVLPGIVPGVGLQLPEGIHGCGATTRGDEPVPPIYQGALWWSANGSSWARVQLPGVVSDAYADMQVAAIDDRTLLAIETTNNADWSSSRRTAWMSRDGKTWTPTPGLASESIVVLYGRARGFIAVGSELSAVDDRGRIVPLTQTGARPSVADPNSMDVGRSANIQTVVGPAGLLAYDGSRLWIGSTQGH